MGNDARGGPVTSSGWRPLLRSARTSWAVRVHHPAGGRARGPRRASQVTARVRAVAVPVLARIRRMPPWRIDALLATCFVVSGLTTTAHPGGSYAPRDAFAVGLVLAATLPYYARRLAPLPVFTVSVAAVATLFALGHSGGALPAVIAVGAYTVGAWRPLREVVLAAALLNAALVAMLLAGNPGFGAPQFVTSVAVFAATMLAGWTTQSRRLRLDALQREQVEASRRAAADERLRIAQELHDVVAHSLGVIAVQAGVGMHVIETDPAEARRTLEHISRTSRSSLAEIRRLLGLVRSGEPAVTHTPGLADLPRLAADMTAAGLPVALDIAGDTGNVPPGVELAAYRIVQEALTNTLRHAQASEVRVSIKYSPKLIALEVADNGIGPGGNGSGPAGHGLDGMRERVALLGGSVTAGPNPGRGYLVHAELPL